MEILASPNECCQVADPHDPGTGERRTVLGFTGLSTIRGSLCPPHLVNLLQSWKQGRVKVREVSSGQAKWRRKQTRAPEKK